MISLAVAVNYIMFPSSRLQSRINVFGACWICVFAANPIRNDKSSPQPRCVNTLSNAILVEWDAVQDSDRYYVALCETENSRPFALQTSDGTNLTVHDLMPGTTYFLRLRSHPAAEPTIAWAPGWNELSAAVPCTTSAVPDGQITFTRHGDVQPTSIAIEFTHNTSGSFSSVPVSLLHVPQEADVANETLFSKSVTQASKLDTGALWTAAAQTWTQIHVNATQLTSGGAMANITDLDPGSTYYVKLGHGESSDAVMMKTSTPGMLYTTLHRISEYAEDVDFLENHNSASVEAMPLYLMTCSPEGNCQPWNKTQFTKTDADWDRCEVTLAQLCPGHRGTGFNGCVQCMDEHRAAVVRACGNYTNEDSEHKGYPVHYYCGVGWPENLMYFSAITEYCVEHDPAPHADPRWGPGGFSQYASCNSDEVDAAFNNSARDPSCMCWVYDDRTMSLLPKAEYEEKCSGSMPWYVHEKICNCTPSKQFPDSTMILPEDTSYNYIGAMPTFLPWGYYREPLETYPVRIPMGYNYYTPKHGACGETEAPGTNGCTWRRHASARMIYGPDLFATGWDDRYIPDTLTNQSHTRYNVKVFEQTTHLRDHLLARRCCGC